MKALIAALVLSVALVGCGGGEAKAPGEGLEMCSARALMHDLDTHVPRVEILVNGRKICGEDHMNTVWEAWKYENGYA